MDFCRAEGVNIIEVLLDMDKPTTIVTTTSTHLMAYQMDTVTALADLDTGMVVKLMVFDTARSDAAAQQEQHDKQLRAEKAAQTHTRHRTADHDDDSATQSKTGPTRRPMPDDIEQVLSYCKEHGLITTQRRNGHYAITHPHLPGQVFCASTPSDHRAPANTTTFIRSTFGIDIRTLPN